MERAALYILMLMLLGACASMHKKLSPFSKPLEVTKSISHPTCSKDEMNITGLLFSFNAKKAQELVINKIAIFPYRNQEKLILPGKLLREVLWFDPSLVIFSEIMHDGEDSFILALISFEKKSDGQVKSTVVHRALKTCQEVELILPLPNPLLFNVKIEFINDIIVK